MRSATSAPKRCVVGALLVTALLLAPHAQAQDQWRWSITPYMWATDISEDLILDGQVVGGGDTEFNDLADKIVTSMQLHFEGIKDRWGVFADVSHVDLRDSQTGEQGLGRLEADIKETATEAGLIFRPGGSSGRLDLLVGVRILSIIEKYRLELGQIVGPFELRVDDDYLDALIGARWLIPFSDRWAVSLRGDVSAGGTDYTWTAQGLLAWRFGKYRNSAVFAGYQYRELKYTKADVLEDHKTLSGPGLGLRIGF